MSKVVAITCSDIHLSELPPVFRAKEKNWFEAMARPLREIRQLAIDLDAPILCAGDVFDKWNATSKLINFAIDTMPKMHAIPGQHDLPYHSLDRINESAYGTLERCGLIETIAQDGNGLIYQSNERIIQVIGFPWGAELKNHTRPKTTKKTIQIALVHKYCWTSTFSYPGASKEEEVAVHSKKLSGFDIAVFGDNHKGFLTLPTKKTPTVLNHGSFLIRKSDEMDHTPVVGLIYSDGSVRTHKLDLSKDVYAIAATKETTEIKENAKLIAFLDNLSKLGYSKLDFEEAVKAYLKKNTKISKSVSEIINNYFQK